MKREFRMLGFALVFVSCGGNPTDVASLPEWLDTLIEQLESEPVANPPAFIARWEYASGVYYYLPPRCCDVFSDLYDAEGRFWAARHASATGQRSSGAGPASSQD